MTMSFNVKAFTADVRMLMKGMGRSVIYNNLYKSGTRTIKCALRGASVVKFAKQVDFVAKEHGLVDVTVHSVMHDRKRMYGPQDSLIVRIPAQ